MSDKVIHSSALVARIADQLELPTSTVEAVIKEFQRSVTEQLSEGGEVRLAGFGTFKAVERGARTARNPRTGELIDVGEHLAVRFVPGKNFKSKVEGEK